MDPIIHETFNTPLGDTGDFEGHSVIRTENGGVWYADEVDPSDEVVEDHAEIVRRVNLFPALVSALESLLKTGPKEGDLRLSLIAMKQDALDSADIEFCKRYGASVQTARDIVKKANSTD